MLIILPIGLSMGVLYFLLNLNTTEMVSSETVANKIDHDGNIILINPEKDERSTRISFTKWFDAIVDSFIPTEHVYESVDYTIKTTGDFQAFPKDTKKNGQLSITPKIITITPIGNSDYFFGEPISFWYIVTDKLILNDNIYLTKTTKEPYLMLKPDAKQLYVIDHYAVQDTVSNIHSDQEFVEHIINDYYTENLIGYSDYFLSSAFDFNSDNITVLDGNANPVDWDSENNIIKTIWIKLDDTNYWFENTGTLTYMNTLYLSVQFI